MQRLRNMFSGSTARAAMLPRILTRSGLASAISDFRPPDEENGPANAHSRVRLFGQCSKEQVRVILYRDHHAWCPYCQKVWLFLEEKQIPYRVNKVTMFCYGQKENWFLKHVNARGMLPAVTIDGSVVTDSDNVLVELENAFGPLCQRPLSSAGVQGYRRLERMLFGAWCDWLCRQNSSRQEVAVADAYKSTLQAVEEKLGERDGPFFFGDELSIADIIFVPMLERQIASLYYYKNYDVRAQHPKIARFFDALEASTTYRGTKSDFHTHVHDLPPQMGACFFSDGKSQKMRSECSDRVDYGPFLSTPEVNEASWPLDKALYAKGAAYRLLRHWDKVAEVNPYTQEGASGSTNFDIGVQYALTSLLLESGAISADSLGEDNSVAMPAEGFPRDTELVLRSIRDHISIPRDMNIWSGKLLRQALESTAALISDRQSEPLCLDHRRDQNPTPFAGHIPPIGLPETSSYHR